MLKRSGRLPTEEDAFLWHEEVPTPEKAPPSARRITLTDAERMAIKLSFDVAIKSAFLLEDPHERLFRAYGHLDVFTHLPQSPDRHKRLSDELTHHLYEVSVDGGHVGFEVNPPNVPALSRVILVEGRPQIIIDKLLLAFERTKYFEAHDLQPMHMIASVDTSHVDNRFFRLIAVPSQNKAHDVACLLAWMELEDGTDMLEVSVWPVEKV